METYEKAVAELIDRYVYAVTKRLPQAQREDIEKELRGLIDDILMDRTNGAPPSKEDAEAVLKELGRPSALAAKYRGEEQHLIGPEYFDIYMMVMKVITIVAASATAFAMIIGFIVTPPINVFEAFGKFLSGIISAAINAFAIVTIIFAVIERYAKHETLKGEDWKPSDLPPVPAAKAVIHKSEPIVGLVFAVLGIIIFNAAPWLFGAGEITGNTFFPVSFIPVFNLDVLYRMLPLINIMFCVGILKEVARLVIGRYDFRLAIAVAIFNVISLVLTVYIFAPPAIWNQGFMSSLSTAYGWEWTATSEAARVWSIIQKAIVGLSIFGIVVDTITTAVRASRHSLPREKV